MNASISCTTTCDRKPPATPRIRTERTRTMILDILFAMFITLLFYRLFVHLGELYQL